MRRILLALALAAMMAVVPACAAVAAPAPDARTGPPAEGDGFRAVYRDNNLPL